MNYGSDITGIFMAITACYVLFCGISGKGKIYDDETIHETRKTDYAKTIRLFSLTAPFIIIIGLILEMFEKRFWGQIALGIFFLALIALVVIIWPMNKERTEKRIRKK